MHWSEIPGSAYPAVMDPELLKARRFIQEKIFDFLVQRQTQTNEILSQRSIIDLVKRLEEALFRTAASQEQYLNLDTLESRLHVFIKKPSSQSTSALVGTMIPGYSPGMSQHENSNSIASAADSSSVSLLATETGSSAADSSAMQSVGNQMGGGMTSSVQLRSYPLQDGSGNGGFGSYIQPLNGSGSSENYLTTTEIGGSGSPKSTPSV